MQFILFFILILNSIIFLLMNHPLSMGLLLMMQTLIIALMSGIFTKFFWFSYCLFLIFMGGMLILFMYMTSLASNEIFKFKINKKKILFFLILFFFLLLMFNILDLKIILNFNNKILNNDNFSLNYLNLMMEKMEELMMIKMFNFPMNFITILLVNYLFFTLVMSVKITNIFKGPLRQKIY